MSFRYPLSIESRREGVKQDSTSVYLISFVHSIKPYVNHPFNQFEQLNRFELMSSSQTSAGRDSGGPFVHTVPNYLADVLVFGFAAYKSPSKIISRNRSDISPRILNSPACNLDMIFIIFISRVNFRKFADHTEFQKFSPVMNFGFISENLRWKIPGIHPSHCWVLNLQSVRLQ